MEGPILQVPPSKPSDKRAYLTLLEDEWRGNTSNIPVQAWEALAFLHNEAIHHRQSVLEMKVPQDLELLRMNTLAKWDKLIAYHQGLLEKSGSVDGFKTNALVEAMRNQVPQGMNPAAYLVPTVAQEEKNGGRPLARR